jgi:three-Cys-motif partner protein
MASKSGTKQSGPLQPWGGPWTEQKLKAVTKYLSAYTKILSGKGLEYWYVDAFSGAGFREVPRKKSGSAGGLFETVPDQKEMREFMAGSAVHALRADPSFEKYVFCDSNPTSLAILQKRLERDFPALRYRVAYNFGDANEALQMLCRNWRSRRRAVMFVDPFGMQVSWDTLTAIAGTKGADLWILFPLGAVNRMLTRDAAIPEHWQLHLTRQFGTDTWREKFYAESHPSLFDEPSKLIKVATPDGIIAFYVERLRTIFPYVAPNPLKLTNTKGSPLYALCFAAANPREGAGGLGAKIAHQILLKS